MSIPPRDTIAQGTDASDHPAIRVTGSPKADTLRNLQMLFRSSKGLKLKLSTFSPTKDVLDLTNPETGRYIMVMRLLLFKLYRLEVHGAPFFLI